MTLRSSIASRPLFWIIVLAIVIVSIPVSVILVYHVMSARIEHSIQFACEFVHQQVLQDIKIISGFLLPLNASALNLARVLRPTGNATRTSFSDLKTMVAPKLFLAYSMLPISEIAFIGSDGLFLSYYSEGNRTLAMYSNTTSIPVSSNASSWYKWYYTQQVDNATGIPYGEATRTNSSLFANSSWYKEAIKSSNGWSRVGTGFGKTNESLFLSVAAIDGGLISLGLSVRYFTEAISSIKTLGGAMFLATQDGNLLAHSGSLNTSMMINNDTVTYEFLTSDSGLASKVNFSCQPSSNSLRVQDVEIMGEKYMFYCEPLEIAGVQSVSVLVFPQDGLLKKFQKNKHLSLGLLGLSLISMVVLLIFFIFFIRQSVRIDMILRGKLMKQMEATQQAERKSMSKTLAFSQASHDIRGSLTAIVSLIDFSRGCVPCRSDIDNNLSDMKTSSMELLELLDSVLDTSKIEAGKMQLEEKDFDLAQVIEDVINMLYPKGIEKGVDIIFDPCDGSVLKSSLVRGDPGKLKQILMNLVSNAVKFTSEGHVTLRAWIKKPTADCSVLDSRNDSTWKSISRLFYRNKEETYNNVLHARDQVNQNSIEFVCEVEDTGIGIPKDKRKSVFENFVQVRDRRALEQGGTGLGLGIVQSLVRLMGGEIKIVDKELREGGTCFHFNIFLSASETVLNDLGACFWNQYSPKVESSHVVLLIQGNERRKVMQNFLASLGLKVSALTESEQLLETLEKIKHRSYLNYPHSTSRKLETGSSADHLSNSASHNSSAGFKDVVDRLSPFHRHACSRSVQSSILIVIDDSLQLFPKMCSLVENFSKGFVDSCCKVVGLVSSYTTSRAKKDMRASCDHIVYKPFHGTRLYQVLKLLPEFGGNSIEEKTLPPSTDETAQLSIEHNKTENFETGNPQTLQYTGRREIYKVLDENKASAVEDRKFLEGNTVMVVEDTPTLRMIASRICSDLGATVVFCENGQEAVLQVCKALKETHQDKERTSKVLPYNLILMDCEMPVMNGYEATQQIRKEEQRYDIHIPIIALSAHKGKDEVDKSIEAGMDCHITKPLNKEILLDAISRMSNQGAQAPVRFLGSAGNAAKTRDKVEILVR